MTSRDDFHHPDRRGFLRRAGLAVAAGASLALLDSAPSPAFASPGDPDQLFKEGRFVEAERGYRRLLRKDPRNAHASAQVGYIALLSNRFGDAEKHLSKAVALQSGDVASAQRLAECFVRQDQLARAVPLLQSTGRPRDKAYADLYSHISGTPWQIHGAQSAHVKEQAGEAFTLGDALLLERLVHNLVENAVRHNVKDGGWVSVLSRTHPDATVEVEVSNTGPTVPPYEIPSLFEPFRRLGDERLVTAKGAGLGLSIVRSVVRAHEGHINARPREGGGLTVSVTLPACEPS
ncbi:ATP-binding protein [Sphaerisporangium sp. NBC_01403]|uniref:sensor histidine kinase n=1 Tax=Sphaerisporangium sp. NBC_01403 TaxID=2903599 RepID=UPI00324DA8B2